jgi:DNA (cytosine-5)-methyltransferase 1
VSTLSSSRRPVIDLFAGPGGLGEGFAQCKGYKICLSVEMDPVAHQTLELRSFYRQFKTPPPEYYQHVRGEITREQLFDCYPKESKSAKFESCLAELGTPAGNSKVNRRVEKIEETQDLSKCVMIGGPPCQAYSLVGRSRRSGSNKGGEYDETKDVRHLLYKQYLRLIKKVKPAAFVMENVRGILSSNYKGVKIFPQILCDLEKCGYKLHSLSGDSLFDNHPEDYLVKMERFGIPQRRARVFVVGIRNDIDICRIEKVKQDLCSISVQDAIDDLPNLRSGLSKCQDTHENWLSTISKSLNCHASKIKKVDASVFEHMQSSLGKVKTTWGRGISFKAKKLKSQPQGDLQQKLHDWLRDDSLEGVLNHETRSHIQEDLIRYLFYSSWASIKDVTPSLKDIPECLLPKHRDVQAQKKSMGKVAFADRFRTQVYHRPSTTITAHISKDGHAYIHPDPSQCRSLTVREAARLQTFPDNYMFCGPRTEQYRQVGNAVPPYFAFQIAQSLLESLI